MAARWSWLASVQVALAGATLALGVPATFAAFHELSFHSRLNVLGAMEVAHPDHSDESVARLLEAAPQTSTEQLELAFALLSHGDDPALSKDRRAAVVTKATQEFRDYLARIPGDGRAWAGLASADIWLGDPKGGAGALRMSILTAPWSESLVQWRCGLGIDLFRALNAEERELMKGQFRVAAQRSAAALAQTVIRRNGTRIARTFLASSPDELIKFEAELAKQR